MLMILLCTLPGVSAQPMTGCQESNLGWLITSCFCIYGFYWIISILVKACQNLCNCVLQHRPTKSVAHCVAWVFCYFMLCAIFVPSALTDDLHLTGCLLCVCTLAVTNCWFWKLAKAKRRMILQCQFVRKRRHKRWRGIFRCRHRSRCPSPITCICVKPCIPDAHVHECNNASDAFQWHHLHGGTAGASNTTKKKRNEHALLKGLQELLQSFSDEASSDEPRPNDQDTLLSALQKLVKRAERDPQHLLNRLKDLVAAASAGKRRVTTDNTPAGQHPTHAKPMAQPKAATWADKVKASHPVQPSPIYRLWTSPDNRDSIATAAHVKKELENGKMPVATLVAANYETATELKTLAQAHGLTEIKTAVVLTFGDCPGDLENRWVHVTQKGHGPELIKFPVVALGKALPTFPTCQVAPAALPTDPVEAMTLRVTIPFCFCKHSWRNCQSKPANVVSGMLRDYDLQKTFISTYGWRTLQSQRWTGYAEAVTGFLKVDKSGLDGLLRISGKHGVFIEHLAQNRPGDVIDIEWISQEHDEDDMTYFTRVTSQAHDNGFTYRRQGKSRLGLRPPQGTMPTASNRAKVWEARGVSHQWSTGILTSWLKKQKFEDISLMSQPRKGRGWLFRAKHASNSFCFAFENDKGENISISQHFHHAKAPKQTPIKAAGKSMGHTNVWNTLNGSMGVSRPKAAEVKNAEQDDAQMPQSNGDGETSGDTKRPAPPGSSPEKKRVHLHKDFGDRSETNFQGYEFADAGGNGDCGYRSLAVAYAIQDSRDVDTAIQAGRPMGATLRAQNTSHISKYRHFESVFAIDPRWTIELEGGPVPTTYTEWVESTARPNRWIDGPCLSTAATELRRNIAIWKWETDHGSNKLLSPRWRPIRRVSRMPLKPGERNNFHNYVKKHQYRMFDGPSRIRHKNAWGGVILRVKCTVRCRMITSFSEDDGQVVTVMVENCAISCLYQPPEESRRP